MNKRLEEEKEDTDCTWYNVNNYDIPNCLPVELPFRFTEVGITAFNTLGAYVHRNTLRTYG